MLSREELTAEYGQVWSTADVQQAFEIRSFLAPYVSVVRRSDNKRGSLQFQHDPRYYFSFEEGQL